jgi:hypothetical protein
MKFVLSWNFNRLYSSFITRRLTVIVPSTPLHTLKVFTPWWHAKTILPLHFLCMFVMQQTFRPAGSYLLCEWLLAHCHWNTNNYWSACKQFEMKDWLTRQPQDNYILKIIECEWGGKDLICCYSIFQVYLHLESTKNIIAIRSTAHSILHYCTVALCLHMSYQDFHACNLLVF